MTLTVLVIFVPILVIILLFLNYLAASSKPDIAKKSAFECGILPLSGQTRAPFSILYYLVCILFLSFDLEILIIFPIASTLSSINIYGYVVAIVFFFVLTFGFVVELAYGILSFENQRSKDISIKP